MARELSRSPGNNGNRQAKLAELFQVPVKATGERYGETVQVGDAPKQVSYEELLGVFGDSHHPMTTAWARQFMSLVFYYNDEPKKLALETKKAHARVLNPVMHFP